VVAKHAAKAITLGKPAPIPSPAYPMTDSAFAAAEEVVVAATLGVAALVIMDRSDELTLSVADA
jgi:hypothetical protein